MLTNKELVEALTNIDGTKNAVVELASTSGTTYKYDVQGVNTSTGVIEVVPHKPVTHGG